MRRHSPSGLSTLDLVIACLLMVDRVTEAAIAEDDLTTGSDHETLE